jgi:serine/threonine protein kinase
MFKSQYHEAEVRFISAQLVLVLSYLHSLNVVYRDLKLENILIDERGYIKLIDFGISKQINVAKKERTYSLKGTEQYMAPEIARLMNVPAYYISADMNNSMTYANVQDERRQFVSLSLQPYISAIEARLSMNDITPSTQYISFDLDSGFLRANPMERLLVIEKMLALGLISVQDAMAMEELSPNGSASDAINLQ